MNSEEIQILSISENDVKELEDFEPPVSKKVNFSE